MSAALLTRVRDHLANGGLLTGYVERYFRWTDADIDGNTPFILFRMAGSQGALTDFSVQYPDVSVILVDNPSGAVAAAERCREILQYVRDDYDGVGFLYLDPLSPTIGPLYLENGRPLFQIEFRAIVSDH